MPRELINPDGAGYVVRVGWDHVGSVQVGVEAEGERSLFWALLGHEPDALRTLGEQVRKGAALDYEDDESRARALLDTLDTVSGGGYRGVWSHLDRWGCNRLISVVRRARDAAFGRDE
jgi:hypothetical protein